MPPIFPVKNREIPRDPVTTSTAATTLTESTMSMILSTITTTVSTVEDIMESTSEDVTSLTSEEVTESTSEEATTATVTATTVSTVVEEINLEDDDSDTDSFNPGEIPAVLDSDSDEYEDWMPLLQNSSVKKNSR